MRFRPPTFSALGASSLLLLTTCGHQNELADALDAIARDFEGAIARPIEPAEPSNRFTCPYPPEDGGLRDYFDSARSGRYDDARRALTRLHAHVTCTSASRYRDLHNAFVTAAIHRELEATSEVQDTLEQILAPLAFYFFDLGTGPFRADLQPWLFLRSNAWERYFLDPESVLSRIGWHAALEGGLLTLEPTEARLIVANLDAQAWASGACRTVDAVDLPAVATSGPTLLCPKDCLSQTTRLESSLLQSAQEAATLCRDYRQQQQGLRDSARRAAVTACFDQFRSPQDAFMACIADLFKAPHTQLFAAQEEPNLEQEISTRRNCRTAHGRHGYGGNMQLMQHRDPPSGEGPLRLEGHTVVYTDDAGNPVSHYSRRDYFDDDGFRYRTVYQYQDHEGDGYRSVVEYGSDGSVKEETRSICAGHPCDDSDDSFWTWEPEPKEGDEQPPSDDDEVSYCSPESTSCSDSCSVFDQIASDFQACWDGLEEPRQGGHTPPGTLPDPTILLPDPQDPQISSLSAELGQCVAQALAPTTERPITGRDCAAYTRCPDGNEPQGENCRCTPEQRTRVPNPDCNRVLCDPTVIACPCEEFGPRNPEGGDVPVPRVGPMGPEHEGVADGSV